MAPKGNYARSSQGRVSKSTRARSGDIQKADQHDSLPDAGKSGPGVPSAMSGMGTFARNGNESMIPTAVAIQTGLASLGPVEVGPIARTGGQVRLAPGQIKAWAHPKDSAPKESTQVNPDAVVPPPAKPIIP